MIKALTDALATHNNSSVSSKQTALVLNLSASRLGIVVKYSKPAINVFNHFIQSLTNKRWLSSTTTTNSCWTCLGSVDYLICDMIKNQKDSYYKNSPAAPKCMADSIGVKSSFDAVRTVLYVLYSTVHYIRFQESDGRVHIILYCVQMYGTVQ